MIVEKSHCVSEANPWCKCCGKNLRKSHAHDCVYVKGPKAVTVPFFGPPKKRGKSDECT